MALQADDLTDDGAPLFRRIAAELRRDIAEGRQPVGSALPTEAELMARFGVSRSTVRAALAELKNRGLVAGRRGIGTIVTAGGGNPAYREVYGNVAELFAFAGQRPIQDATVDTVVADARLAGLMHSQPGKRYLHISGIRRMRDGQGPPLAAVEIFVDGRYAGIAEDIPTLSCSVAEQIERRFGVEIAYIDQEIEVTTLSPETAALLDSEPGAVALRLSRHYYAAGETPIEFARSLYPADRFSYRTRFFRTGPGR